MEAFIAGFAVGFALGFFLGWRICQKQDKADVKIQVPEQPSTKANSGKQE